MSDKEPPKKPIPSPNETRTEEARAAVQEYAADLLEVIQKLRRKMN